MCISHLIVDHEVKLLVFLYIRKRTTTEDQVAKFSWETYGQQHKPIEPIGFCTALCGYMKALFRLTTGYMRGG